MLRFELAGTPGNHVSIDPAKVSAVTEGIWPMPVKTFLSGYVPEKLVATIWMGNDGNWTVFDPNRTVARQIAAAKKGNPLT